MPFFYFTALLGAVLFSVAESTEFLALGRLLMGVGMACAFIGALKIFTLQFPPASFGTLSSSLYSVGNAGVILATTPLVFGIQAVGWRAALLLAAFFHLIVALIFMVSVRERAGENNPNRLVALPAGRCAQGDRPHPSEPSGLAALRCGIYPLWHHFCGAVHLGGPLSQGGDGRFSRHGGQHPSSAHDGSYRRRPDQRLPLGSCFRHEKMDHGRSDVGALLDTCSAFLLPGGLSAWYLAPFHGFRHSVEHRSSPICPDQGTRAVRMFATAMTFITFLRSWGRYRHAGDGCPDRTPHANAVLSVQAFRDAFLVCAVCMAGAAALYSITREKRKETAGLSGGSERRRRRALPDDWRNCGGRAAGSSLCGPPQRFAFGFPAGPGHDELADVGGTLDHGVRRGVPEDPRHRVLRRVAVGPRIFIAYCEHL